MTGLVIKLKAGEKVLVNGAVLQNGDRPAQIRVRSSDVSILRTRDAIAPEAATTPLKRLYYIAQLALAREAEPQEAARQIAHGVAALKPALGGPAGAELDRAVEAARDGRFFVAMRALKRLFALEAELLARGCAAPAS